MHNRIIQISPALHFGLLKIMELSVRIGGGLAFVNNPSGHFLCLPPPLSKSLILS